jgi:hypothetical protein
MLLICPEDWPPLELTAFEGGALAERDDATEGEAGVRPGPATRIIAIRVRSDGPV